MRLTGISRVLLVSSSALLAACSQLVFGLANAPTYLGGTKRITNLTYGSHPRQSLDVHVPAGARNAPVVIFWYGGSWTRGDKESYRFVGAALVQRGLVAVVPDYRVHPDVRFPAFLDDAAQAVAYVQTHIAQHGGDPSRVILMGHSAGAHIAAYVANHPELLRKAGANAAGIRGLIGLSGPYALDPNSALLHTIFAAPYTHADWQPVRFVTAASPSTLLIHGMRDEVVGPSHTDAMAEALHRAGVPVEVARYEGRNHADTVAAFAWAARHRARILDRCVDFIARVTATDPPHAHKR